LAAQDASSKKSTGNKISIRFTAATFLSVQAVSCIIACAAFSAQGYSLPFLVLFCLSLQHFRQGM
jgi:hypothetical protein